MKTDYFALWRPDSLDDSKIGVSGVSGVATHPELSNDGVLRDTKTATPKEKTRCYRCGKSENAETATPATPSENCRCGKMNAAEPSTGADFSQVPHLKHLPHLKTNNTEHAPDEAANPPSEESTQMVIENIKAGKPTLMDMPGYGRVYWVKDQHAKEILRDQLIAEQNPIPIYALGELQSVPIKRVQCHNCTFFIRDKIGSGGGLGKCEINAIHHPKQIMFPGVLRRCDYHKPYEPKDLEKMASTHPHTANTSNNNNGELK